VNLSDSAVFLKTKILTNEFQYNNMAVCLFSIIVVYMFDILVEIFSLYICKG